MTQRERKCLLSPRDTLRHVSDTVIDMCRFMRYKKLEYRRPRHTPPSHDQPSGLHSSHCALARPADFCTRIMQARTRYWRVRMTGTGPFRQSLVWRMLYSTSTDFSGMRRYELFTQRREDVNQRVPGGRYYQNSHHAPHAHEICTSFAGDPLSSRLCEERGVDEHLLRSMPGSDCLIFSQAYLVEIVSMIHELKLSSCRENIYEA